MVVPLVFWLKVSPTVRCCCTLQRGRELFVLHVGQTQRFAGYGLFKHEGFTTLRNRGGSNHLVLDPVAKLTLVHAFQMNPTQHVVEPGLATTFEME